MWTKSTPGLHKESFEVGDTGEKEPSKNVILPITQFNSGTGTSIRILTLITNYIWRILQVRSKVSGNKSWKWSNQSKGTPQ